MLSIATVERRRIAVWVAASSLALALAACGGGTDTVLRSTPTPPVAPPPPPPALTISAPAKASVGPGVVPVMATGEDPNFTTGPTIGTTFPLLQTVLLLDDSTIRPDPGIYETGGVAVAEPGDLSINTNNLVDVTSTVDSSLDWTRAGWWEARIEPGPWDYGGPVDYRGAFVAGYETPAADMPTTGTATYNGTAYGHMYVPLTSKDALPCMCQEVPVQGDALFTANFGTRVLSGELTNMYRVWWDEGAWNNVTFTSTITGNSFTGTTSVTTAPTNAMGLNATGTLEGRFFGPSAEEAGAVWTLFDGTNAATGTLSGRRGP